MKKKTKIILSVAAAIILVLGIAGYTAASLYFPLNYEGGYTPTHTPISQEEYQKINPLRETIHKLNSDPQGSLDVKREISVSVADISLPEALGDEGLTEKLMNAFGFTDKTETVTYEDGYFYRDLDYLMALNSYINISNISITENEDGSTVYEIALTDEVCYFTGAYIWTVYPYMSPMLTNVELLEAKLVDTDDIKELTDGIIVRNADIIFPGTVLTFTADKDGNLISIRDEIPVKCTAKLITGLFGREEVSAELTKITTYTF